MTASMFTLLMASMARGPCGDAASPGASLVFVSRHPDMVALRDLLDEGRLAEAERLLARYESDAAAEWAEGLEQGREIIRRLRREYGLRAETLLDKLRTSIPDIAADDLERWRQAGQVQWRWIDGQVCFFRREPANLFRFCDEAIRRRAEHASKATSPAGDGNGVEPISDQQLNAHLAEVVAAARKSGRPRVMPVHHRVCYTVKVLPDRPHAVKGSLVRCWLPFPQEYRYQFDVKLIRTTPAQHLTAPNGIRNDRLAGARQRTVYLEQEIEDPSRPVVFEEVFEYVSCADVPEINEADARALPADHDGGDLSERPPHIVFTPELRKTVRDIVEDETNPLIRARRIFHFIDAGIRYCSEEEYSVIPSFSKKALATRRGDCGIQSMLFITMCRAAGIPARWQSGWVTGPDPRRWNMHDWAEFYVEPWGWLPADVSYGLRKSTDPAIREFFFGHRDSYRLIVNLDYGSPLHPPKRSLRSEPADFQRGEVELDGRNLYYDEWDWDFQVELKPLTSE